MPTAKMHAGKGKSALTEDAAAADPFAMFSRWFQDAGLARIPDPNAMTLATASTTGDVSARIVLLKGFDERGFCFYTNYESRKGRVLSANPRAALVFFWQPLERQVRIEGTVERLTAAESDDYFRSRPAGSRIGAIASPQSQVIPDRESLERRFKELEKQHPDGDVGRPSHWGGYRLVPHMIEFWQGRENRLHDRLQYRRSDKGWIRERLAP